MPFSRKEKARGKDKEQCKKLPDAAVLQSQLGLHTEKCRSIFSANISLRKGISEWLFHSLQQDPLIPGLNAEA